MVTAVLRIGRTRVFAWRSDRPSRAGANHDSAARSRSLYQWHFL